MTVPVANFAHIHYKICMKKSLFYIKTLFSFSGLFLFFKSINAASSPDLATLVRKAKERSAAQQTTPRAEENMKNDGGATSNQHTRDSFQRNRQRSSTTVNHSSSTSTQRAKLTKGQRNGEGVSATSTPLSSDWVVPGPSNRLGTVANKVECSIFYERKRRVSSPNPLG